MYQIDYSSANLWSLAYTLRNTPGKEECLVVDTYLVQKVNTIEDINEINYNLYHGKPDLFPLLQIKIDKIIRDIYLSGEVVDILSLSQLDKWLSLPTKEMAISKWIKDRKVCQVPIEIVTTVFSSRKDYQIDILKRLTKIYKKYKFTNVVKNIGNLFKAIDSENLEKSCEILSSSTPLIQALFLKRGDISEKYTLMGIKALSKLSTQRDVDVKIDFHLLEKLGPSGRFKAMQQLMGMFDKYYKNMIYYKEIYPNDYYFNQSKEEYKVYGRSSMPFKEIPSKEDVERFLFPCSLKFHDKVSELVLKYEEFLKSVNKPKE